MIRIQEIFEGKGQVCEKILRSLPSWFGIEEALVNYVKEVELMPTFVAKIENETIGFLALKRHGQHTAEIFVMGILERYHRRGIGKMLLEWAEQEFRQKGCYFLSVKTLSPSRPNAKYEGTRSFYTALGFRIVEEFPLLWGEENPCLFLIKFIGPHVL